MGLAGRGLSVLGVELDPRMAEVARGHGIPVEVGAFETWDDAGRRFDLITCGAAWHWLDPELGMTKASHVLRAGGTIARFWNYHVLGESVMTVLEAVYREHAPEAHPHGRAPDDSGYVDPFTENEAFCSVETRTYRWERTLSADEWVGQAATFSALNPSVSALSRERCTRRSQHSAAPSRHTAEPTSCWPAALSLAPQPSPLTPTGDT